MKSVLHAAYCVPCSSRDRDRDTERETDGHGNLWTSAVACSHSRLVFTRLVHAVAPTFVCLNTPSGSSVARNVRQSVDVHLRDDAVARQSTAMLPVRALPQSFGTASLARARLFDAPGSHCTVSELEKHFAWTPHGSSTSTKGNARYLVCGTCLGRGPESDKGEEEVFCTGRRFPTTSRSIS